MANPKSATKRKAEKDVAYYREKLRKAEERQRNAAAELSGQRFLESDDELGDHPLFCVDNRNAVHNNSAAPPIEPEARAERSPRPQANCETREIQSSNTKPQTSSRAPEADSSMRRSVRPLTDIENIKIRYPSTVVLTPPPTLQANSPSVKGRKEHSPSSCSSVGTKPGTSQAYMNPLADGSDEPEVATNDLESCNQSSVETLQTNQSMNTSVMNGSKELLDVFSSDGSLIGENIHSKLVENWSPVLKKGLKDKNNIMKKYAIPGNCKLLKTPFLNEEVSAIIDEHAQARDTHLQSVQDQMGLGLTALAKGITTLIEQRGDYVKRAMEHFRDGGLLLADIHFDQSKVRRFLCFTGVKQINNFIRDKFCNDLPYVIRNSNQFSSLDVAFDRDDTLFGLKSGKVFKKYPAYEKEVLNRRN